MACLSYMTPASARTGSTPVVPPPPLALLLIHQAMPDQRPVHRRPARQRRHHGPLQLPPDPGRPPPPGDPAACSRSEPPLAAYRRQLAGRGGHCRLHPASGYFQNTYVTLKIPDGPDGIIPAGRPSAGTGGLLVQRHPALHHRLVQYPAPAAAAQPAGYPPLTGCRRPGPISPGNVNAELSAAYRPPAGTFSWTGGYPSNLKDRWRAGPQHARRRRGAGLRVGGRADHGRLRRPHRHGEGRAQPERLHLRADRPGAAGDHQDLAQRPPGTAERGQHRHPGLPTADGTLPVYLRYYFQIMRGTNPDDIQYADLVYYVSYFNGGDAVHHFSRGGSPWSCPGTPRRRPTHISATAAWSASSARWRLS